jgi:hypothetical protein
VGSCGEQRVGRIIEATKAANDDHEVKVNISIPFDEWKLHHKHFAIGEGIAEGRQEVILTTEISEFLFDHDVDDVAFVFTPEQLKDILDVSWKEQQMCQKHSGLSPCSCSAGDSALLDVRAGDDGMFDASSSSSKNSHSMLFFMMPRYCLH